MGSFLLKVRILLLGTKSSKSFRHSPPLFIKLQRKQRQFGRLGVLSAEDLATPVVGQTKLFYYIHIFNVILQSTQRGAFHTNISFIEHNMFSIRSPDWSFFRAEIDHENYVLLFFFFLAYDTRVLRILTTHSLSSGNGTASTSFHGEY